MNSVSATTNTTLPVRSEFAHRGKSAPDERYQNINEPSAREPTAIGQANTLLTERAIMSMAGADTRSEPGHHQYGKISETTNHWLTHGHPAFARLKYKPKNASAILGSKQLSSATNIWVVTEKVHGSNFSFVCFPPDTPEAPPTIRCAKREAFLNEDSDEDNTSFFGFRKVKK
uniref:RNA ligase family protein n=1 Tax=Endozoicomonas sp. ONNA2 TaxID=2828741 RepID=UPI0021483E8C